MDGLCYSTIWGDCDCLRLGENKKLKVTNKVGIYTVSSGTFTSRVHVCLLDTLSPRFLVKAPYLLLRGCTAQRFYWSSYIQRLQLVR